MLNYFFAPGNMKKTPSKVAHNRPPFFQYCQTAQNQPKSQFLFYKKVSLRDFYIMTLVMRHSIFVKYVIFAQFWRLKAFSVLFFL